MTVPLWLGLLPLVAAFAIWLGKIVIKKYVERSVDATFERRIEGVRSDLRVKEAKISALQSSALTNRAGRDAIIEKRRIEATENLWQHSLQLRQYKMAVTTFGLFKVEELSARADKQESVREAVRVMSGVSNERMQELSNIGGDTERLFVPLDAWATYSALRAVIVFAFARLNMIAVGIKDSHKLIDGAYIINILKAAMPSYTDYLDRYGISVVGKLVDPLEELLFKQLRSALNGDDADQQAVEQSAKVLRLVSEFQTEAAATLPKN